MAVEVTSIISEDYCYRILVKRLLKTIVMYYLINLSTSVSK